VTEVDLAGTARAYAARRAFTFPCLDATAGRPHLAGALGAGLCRRLLERGWVVRRRVGERAVRLTEAGRSGLEAVLGVALPPPTPLPVREVLEQAR
jgi:hypothetical protein